MAKMVFSEEVRQKGNVGQMHVGLGERIVGIVLGQSMVTCTGKALRLVIGFTDAHFYYYKSTGYTYQEKE